MLAVKLVFTVFFGSFAVVVTGFLWAGFWEGMKSLWSL